VQQVFAQHAEETRLQHERLTARLEALGGKPSGLKSFMANMFGFAPKTAQIGHDEAEKGTQDLIMAYAVEHSEIAMYEALAVAAATVGDTETEALARQIQQEERRAAELVWNLIAPSARDSFTKVTLGTRQAA
jgi:ferritin-like metal-binding protein YciE